MSVCVSVCVLPLTDDVSIVYNSKTNFYCVYLPNINVKTI